jgi:hypothetical protein
MSGRTILKVESPKTQSIDAVRTLLTWKGHPTNPMPADVSLDNGRLVLVLNGKKDAFYTVTATACSCPAHVWHPGHQCKHQRKFFAESKPATKPTDGETLVKRSGFRPIDTLPGEGRAVKASSFCMVDTTPDATPRELAYWSIQKDKVLWPVEA